jgi:hypothetical protein
MNLRNGKQTAALKVTVSKKEKKPDAAPVDLEKERIDNFIAQVNSMFFEAEKYTASTYGRICVYSEIYEVVNGNIDEFKHAPRLATLCDSIRESALRNLSSVGKLTMKHGKDTEFLEAIVRLSTAMLTVLAKLGSAA